LRVVLRFCAASIDSSKIETTLCWSQERNDAFFLQRACNLNPRQQRIGAHEEAKLSQTLLRCDGQSGSWTSAGVGCAGKIEELGRQFPVQHGKFVFCQIA
jgi:hypothetical protein